MMDSTINGVHVHSNKNCSIDIDGVRHESGSSAGPARPVGKIPNGPKAYDASPLSVRNIGATVRIETHQRNAIEVTIAGPADEVNTIRADVRGPMLML